MRSLASIVTLAILLSLPSSVLANRETDNAKLLLNAHTREELDAAISKARKGELSPQIITEAKMLFGLRTQDSVFLESLLPELNNLIADFNPHNSIAGMASTENLRGMIAYVHALSAMEQHNEQEFREQITEAFWNYPQQSDIFGSAVEQFQLGEKMQRWAIDFSMPLLESGGRQTTLGNVIGGQKLLILFFWSSTNTASVDLLSYAQHLSDVTQRHNIGVACVNMDRKDAEEASEKVREKLKLKLPWLIESEERTLTNQIEISSMPRIAVITQQGRVIYHGHPLDMKLWKELRRFAPTLTPVIGK